jgi:hypothetical protein
VEALHAGMHVRADTCLVALRLGSFVLGLDAPVKHPSVCLGPVCSSSHPHDAASFTLRGAHRGSPTKRCCAPQRGGRFRSCHCSEHVASEGSWMGAQHSLPKQEHARRCQVESWVRGTDEWLARLERRGAPATLRTEYKEAIRVWCDLISERNAWRKREGAVLRQVCVGFGC